MRTAQASIRRWVGPGTTVSQCSRISRTQITCEIATPLANIDMEANVAAVWHAIAEATLTRRGIRVRETG